MPNIIARQILEDEQLYSDLIKKDSNQDREKVEYEKPKILSEGMPLLGRGIPMPGPCNPPAPRGKRGK